MALLSHRCARLVGAASLLASTVLVFGPDDATAVANSFPVTAAIPVGHDPSDVAVDPSTGTVYVTNASDNTVSAIDEATNTVVATIGVGQSPQAVAVDPSLHAVYVANSGDNTVSVVDDQRNTLVASLGVGGAPTDIAVDPGTHTIYTADEADNLVSVITVSSGGGYSYSHIEVTTPAAVAVDALRHTAYVAGKDGTVSVIDEAENTVTTTIALDRGLDDVTTDPASGNLFVASYSAGTTSVVDEATNTVTTSFGHAFHHGENFPPYALAIDSGLRNLYLSNGYSELDVLDETNHGVIGRADYPAHGRIAVDENTHAVYVTNESQGTVAVITPTGFPRPTISASLHVGAAGPSASITVPGGTPVTESATLTGPNVESAGGTVRYSVSGSDTCLPPYFDAGTVTVVNGSVPPSLPVALDGPGTYYWQVSYSGDDDLGYTSTACNAVRETITTACPATPTVDRTVSGDQSTTDRVIAAPALTTTGNQRLLLAFVEADGPAAPTQSVASVTGGGLMWTFAVRSNRTWGTSEVWQAHTISPLSGAVVSARLAKAAHGSITVAVLHTAATQIRNVATASGVGGPATDTITPRSCRSLIMAAGHDWTNARKITPGYGQSLLHVRRDTAVGDSFWAQRFTRGTNGGDPVTVTATGPSHDRWTMAAVEVPGR